MTISKPTPLSLELAVQLHGRKVQLEYTGYNGLVTKIVTISTIASREAWARTQTLPNTDQSLWDYWRSYMTQKQLNDESNTLELLNARGEATFIRKYPNGQLFTCSDSDRIVYVTKIFN